MLKTAAKYLFPSIIGTNPATAFSQNPVTAAAALEANGGILNNGAIYNAIQALASNGAPQSGNQLFQTSAAASITLTNIAGLTLMLTNGGAVTVTMDNAPNIVAQIPGPYVGMTFPMMIAVNAVTTVAAPTVTNTGITLSGTTTVTSGGSRNYRGQITQLTTNVPNSLTSGTTFTSIAQIGSSNLYTLTVATNAITTVVGNLIFIGVTAGTLPAGWYPVYSAGTTSIVVALPPSGTAWTATAATMVQPTTVPVTLAPLITLTGMYGMSAGVIVV